MNIETNDPILPHRLKNSAPAGVSVIFDPPMQTREFDSAIPAIIITIQLAANVDVKLVAAWLANKLSASQYTQRTTKYSKTEIEVLNLFKFSHEKGEKTEHQKKKSTSR